MPTEHCVRSLACAKVCSALKMVEGKQEKQWLFTDDMVETVKVNMEGRGVYFKGDLVKLFGEVREMMVEEYEETDFGPKEVLPHQVHVGNMSKEFRSYKAKVTEDEKKIKLGYERIKSKVKKTSQ